MKKIAIWSVLVISAVLVGCIVPSVYPFYTDKDVTFEQGLVGTWASATDENEKWSFTPQGDQAYQFLMIKPSDTNEFAAHLFKLKGRLFLDCQFVQPVEAGIPPHYLAQVAQITPRLKLSTLNYKWAAEFLEKNPDAVQHLMAYDKPGDTNTLHVVLTAETKQLQKFILKYADDTNAWVEMDEMKKVEAK